MAKSITIKIGADTKDFIKGLKNADKEINSTKRSADSLSKSLDVKYSDSKFTTAQKQYQKALAQTEEKAQALRERLQSPDYERLSAELVKAEAAADDLNRELDALNNKKTDKITQGIEDVGNKLTSAGKSMTGVSVAAAGMLAGAGAATKKAATLGAELDDLALRYGVSAETMQEWRYVAVQCGVESDTFTKSLVKMRAGMADLATGTENTATKALRELGISPDQFRTQEEMFDGIVAALRGVKDATLQTAYANDIFGDKIATQILPYVNAASADINKFKEEFAAMPSLTNEQVSTLATLDDSFYRLSATMQYATAQMGVALVPVMETGIKLIEDHFVPAITSLANWFAGLDPWVQKLIVGLLAITAISAPALMMFGKMATGVSALIKLLKSLHGAQLKTAAGFAAIAGAAALGIDIIANWKNMSTVEKILKTLAMAALVAAAAMAVFHASWSVGVAVGAIAAGIAAGLAAINSAKEKLLPNEEDFTVDNLEGKTEINPEDYDYSKWTNDVGNSYNNDYSQNNAQVNVVVNVTQPGATAEEIGAVVSREVATIVQARR